MAKMSQNQNFGQVCDGLSHLVVGTVEGIDKLVFILILIISTGFCFIQRKKLFPTLLQGSGGLLRPIFSQDMLFLQDLCVTFFHFLPRTLLP